MPTTQPLDEDELGDIAEGPLRKIAGFGQGTNDVVPATARVVTGETRSVQTGSNNASRPPVINPPQPNPLNKSRAPRLRVPSIGLNGKSLSHESRENESKNIVTPSSKRVNPFTEADLLKAWDSFIAKNSSHHLLINAMRAGRPKTAGNNVFKISQSKVHLSYIRENLENIRIFVCDALQNDNITFVLEEVSEHSPLTWNDREFLRHVIEKNNAVGDFIKNLNLSIH